ncbi:MAG: hypothetical protein HY876_02465 [Coriobacteriales bacterium]|nr:hypothetical protein [Coriobacteriales bacterium]
MESLRAVLAGPAGERLYDWLGSDESHALVSSDEYAALTALTMAADSAKLTMRRAAAPPRIDEVDGARAVEGASMRFAVPAIPAEVLNALRLGQTLVAEVPAPTGRRAWVSIRPTDEAEDAAARAEGWKRSSHDRRFFVRHAEYLVEHLDGYDYDIGMREVAEAHVADEAGLWPLLAEWGVAPAELDYPWRTAFPE